MAKKTKIPEEFFEGKLSVDEIESGNLESGMDEEFIHTYRKVISKNNEEEIPNFNLFEKIAFQQKKERTNRFKRAFSYAATVVALIGFFSMFFYFNTIRKQHTQTVKIAETQKEVINVLLLFSEELNKTLRNFDEATTAFQPFSDYNNYKIDFNNPMKNLKINEL